jgi:predicted RNA-binding Zn ribbon-like protein
MAIDWAWDGGRPSLDLVNTYRDRKAGGGEQLAAPEDLAEWLTLAGYEGVRPSPARLKQAVGLREAINECVTAVIDAAPLSPVAVELVNHWASRWRPPAPRLRVRAEEPPVAETVAGPDPVATALAEIAVDAVRLLGSADRDGLRICGSRTCGLRFTDRSQAGRRQWCSMSRCGNREKARAHRARARR